MLIQGTLICILFSHGLRFSLVVADILFWALLTGHKAKMDSNIL